MKPLREGRISIAEQAKVRGVDVPEGKTVAELKLLGFDCDPEWQDHWILRACEYSPTGYSLVVRFDAIAAVFDLAN